MPLYKIHETAKGQNRICSTYDYESLTKKLEIAL